MKEIWKDINGYEGYYQASNLGHIKSLARKGRPKSLILKGHCNTQGYLQVALRKGSTKIFLISRLVAESYIPNPESKRTVNHKKGIKLDNRASELEWATHSENHLHAYRELGRHGVWLGKLGKDNPNSESIIQRTISGEFVAEYDGHHDASRKTKINRGGISNACRGIYKTAGGYKWESK